MTLRSSTPSREGFIPDPIPTSSEFWLAHDGPTFGSLDAFVAADEGAAVAEEVLLAADRETSPPASGVVLVARWTRQAVAPASTT